jgi:hypothetical protein
VSHDCKPGQECSRGELASRDSHTGDGGVMKVEETGYVVDDRLRLAYLSGAMAASIPLKGSSGPDGAYRCPKLHCTTTSLPRHSYEPYGRGGVDDGGGDGTEDSSTHASLHKSSILLPLLP